jgi:RNA polymerase sigma factor (sigma-70 family)
MTHSLPPADEPDTTRVFEDHRDLLIGVAYRILGRVTDAEDVVQEAWLRWSNSRLPDVEDPRAFLVRMTTRLAIDQLRRAKARRESYVGPWLPEPVLTSHDVAEDVALAESILMAMLVVLETLSPLERAVFVLREAFGMPHSEIAEVLGRREEAVRQLARRAREHVRERSTRFETDQATRQRVTERFLQATTSGNLEALMAVLAPGVTLVADGGGRALAPRRPLRGSEEVALSARHRDRVADGTVLAVHRDRAAARRAHPLGAGERRSRYPRHIGREADHGHRPRRGRWRRTHHPPGGEPREAGWSVRDRYFVTSKLRPTYSAVSRAGGVLRL